MNVKKGEKLIVRSWVHKDGELVEVSALSPAERAEVATQLKLKRLNAMYAGRATFSRAPGLKEGA